MRGGARVEGMGCHRVFSETALRPPPHVRRQTRSIGLARASITGVQIAAVRPSYFTARRAFSKSDSSCDAKTLLPIDRLAAPPKPSIWSVDVRLAYTTTVPDCVGSKAAVACSQLWPVLT